MGIDFSRTFGAQNNSGKAAADASTSRADQPKAKIWLNVGYVVTGVPVSGATDGSVEDRFVSLPVGIPLDTMEKLPTNSRNESFAQFQAARNSLYDQLMAAASTLKPGDDIVIGVDGGLSIQLRHVADARENIVSTDANPFGIKLELLEVPAAE
jgi:hypothetical protein